MDRVIIEAEECKGCGLCVETCPYGSISIGSRINSIGYQYAGFDGGKCNACGLCFYVCPEPGAITVIRERPSRKHDLSQTVTSVKEVGHETSVEGQ